VCFTERPLSDETTFSLVQRQHRAHSNTSVRGDAMAKGYKLYTNFLARFE
jgi:hypothetical protein